MIFPNLRLLYRKWLYQQIIANAQPIEDLSQPAILFAHHPADEILACGGTILRKRAAGASVHIVFLPSLQTPDPAACSEALAAAQIVGVAAAQVHFLTFSHANLAEPTPEIVAQALALVEQFDPHEIYLPHLLDGIDEHLATTRALQAALAGHPNRTNYAYPLGYYFHWPWVSLNQPQPFSGKRVRSQSLRAYFGLHALSGFSHGVDVRAELRQKRKALSVYSSQMDRLRSGSTLNLADSAAGDFLENFFQSVELFSKLK